MEQVCTICGRHNEIVSEDEDHTVFVICDNCLKSDQFHSLLDQIFLK